MVAEKVMNGETIEWEESSEDEDEVQEEFFTYGIEELRKARLTP
jgi:hypothetical protein